MRPVGWPRMLSEYVLGVQEQYKARGFAWGTFDCCTMGAEWVRLMTGRDPLEAYRGKYATREEAMALAGGDLKAALTKELGEPCPIAQAQRGDLALMGDALGILFTSGRLFALFLGEGGMTLYPANKCDCAFRVE